MLLGSQDTLRCTRNENVHAVLRVLCVLCVLRGKSLLSRGGKNAVPPDLPNISPPKRRPDCLTHRDERLVTRRRGIVTHVKLDAVGHRHATPTG